MIIHAGLIALRTQGAWRGALISGTFGVGKSDLMLRALEMGFRLVSDDRTVVWASDGRLFGLIELRGLGVLTEQPLPLAEATVMVRCEPFAVELERTPDQEWAELEGLKLPLLRLHGLDASAPAKLNRALMRLGQGRARA